MQKNNYGMIQQDFIWNTKASIGYTPCYAFVLMKHNELYKDCAV